MPTTQSPVKAKTTDRYAQAREHFERDTAEHEMTVLHDDGLYRHLRFATPGSFMYGYDLITWPGHLAINGDIDSGYTFARREDMTLFFASGPDINPDYWAEKITNSAARAGTRVYSEDRFHAAVEQAFENSALEEDPEREAQIRAAWAEHIEFKDLNCEDVAHIALRDFDAEGFQFYDWWEWDLRAWDYHFLLCCFAIRAGVEKYRALSPAPTGEPKT